MLCLITWIVCVLDGNIMLRWHLWFVLIRKNRLWQLLLELSIGPGIRWSIHFHSCVLECRRANMHSGVPKIWDHEGKDSIMHFSNVIESNCSRELHRLKTFSSMIWEWSNEHLVLQWKQRWFFKEPLTEWFFVEPKTFFLWNCEVECTLCNVFFVCFNYLNINSKQTLYREGSEIISHANLV